MPETRTTRAQANKKTSRKEELLERKKAPSSPYIAGKQSVNPRRMQNLLNTGQVKSGKSSVRQNNLQTRSRTVGTKKGSKFENPEDLFE